MEFEKTNQAFLLNIAGAPAVTINSDLKNNRSVAKVGVNYKFDWGAPVAARYFIWEASQNPGPQARDFFAPENVCRARCSSPPHFLTWATISSNIQ
jgi:hypothetical protein